MKTKSPLLKPADWQKRFRAERKDSNSLKVICEGLAKMRCIEFRRRGKHYVAEVHAIGFGSEDDEVAFTAHPLGEMSPLSGKNQIPLFRLNEIGAVTLSDRASLGPRMGHKRGSTLFNYIFDEIQKNGPKMPRSIEGDVAKAGGADALVSPTSVTVTKNSDGDRFSNFVELARHKVLGRDYKITVLNRKSRVAIIAPHAGKIELCCSELSRAIAEDSLSLYLFEGIQERDNKNDLHITSHRFDEPKAVDLLKSCESVLAIHGRKNEDDDETIWVGGLDKVGAKLITQGLNFAGFKAIDRGHRLAGEERTNICNRGKSGMGIQLEIPLGLRESLRSNIVTRNKFVAVIRQVIARYPW